MRRPRLFSFALGALAFVACDGAPSNPPASSASSGGASSSGAQASSSGSPSPSTSGTAPPPDTSPPVASGCVTDVSPGPHTFTCQGFATDVTIPDACEKPGCGLITEIHGDTGTGALMDANTNLEALGKENGYVVVAPTGEPWPGGPGSTWNPNDDEKIIAIIQEIAAVFRTDPKKNHLTGFSRGGYVAWRLLCKHADLFASVAPGTAGSGSFAGCSTVGEATCPFDAAQAGGMPSRPIPVLFLMGRTDQPVPYCSTTKIRDQAVAAWSLSGPTTVASDANYTHSRWTGANGMVFETFDHAYETVPDGPWASAKGHCFPGSTMDPYAPQYAVPCKGPDAFTWGDEVMKFFLAHPAP